MKTRSLACASLIIALVFSPFSVSASSSEEAINYLELTGVIDSGKYFRPEDLVTKAELFKMVFKIFGEEASKVPKDSSFEDVQKNEWFAPYAELALEYDLVEGPRFEPALSLSRVEVLHILMKAYGQGASIIPLSTRTPLFMDIQAKHPLYSLVARASELGLVNSNPSEKFHPYQKITRQEVADLLYQFVEWNTVELAEEEGLNEFYKSDILSDIWNRILTDFYLPQGSEIDQEALFQVAVSAILASLNDPYTKYFSGEEATEFMDTLDAAIEGIGAILIQDEKTMEVFITEFLDNSPASVSGLKVGDQIIAVDAVSTEGMLLREVLARIKGPKDTTVEITILREGSEYTYSLTRAVLKLTLVSGEIFHGDSWLIKILSFGNDIVDDFLSTLETLEKDVAQPSSIILDLRGNPGGYVNMTNMVAGLFVPFLTPLVTLDYGGFQETIYNGDSGLYHGIPLYILVDEYTASSSEILTLTLKEKAGASVIGKQTFGKGSAQELLTYWDGSILKMTVAEWLSSNGNSVEGAGVTPDILITEKNGEKDLWLQAVADLLD